MPDTRSVPFYEALKVVWAITPLQEPYKGFERVYVLVGLRYRNTRIITSALEVPNHSPFPEDTFTVLQKDVRDAIEGLSPPKSIIGFAHTHPAHFPTPSINDIRGIARGMLGLVVSDTTTHNWYIRGKAIQPTVRISNL